MPLQALVNVAVPEVRLRRPAPTPARDEARNSGRGFRNCDSRTVCLMHRCAPAVPQVSSRGVGHRVILSVDLPKFTREEQHRGLHERPLRPARRRPRLARGDHRREDRILTTRPTALSITRATSSYTTPRGTAREYIRRSDDLRLQMLTTAGSPRTLNIPTGGPASLHDAWILGPSAVLQRCIRPLPSDAPDLDFGAASRVRLP
jgi:hypothetical protein